MGFRWLVEEGGVIGGSRGTRKHPAIGEYDMPYARCFKDVYYDRSMIEYIRGAEGSDRSTSLYLDHVHFEKP